MADIIPDTRVYHVDYVDRTEPGNFDLGSIGSRSLRTTSVVVGGAPGDPVQTTFADLTKIIAVARWGDPARAEDVIPITISINFARSDL
jgi:hypothetical protein